MEHAARILYGHHDHKTIDVTSIFHARYHKDLIKFNRIFHDPCPFIVKNLYFLDGEDQCLGIMEENSDVFQEFLHPSREWREEKGVSSLPHYELAVGVMFKDESWILKEWLDHYLEEGVEQFFMIDNNSTDDYLPILQPYINQGLVTLFHEERSYVQIDSYNKHIMPAIHGNVDWIIICDMDEFIYSRKEFPRTIDYLVSLDQNISAIAIPWKLFGSSHIVEHPKDGVIPNFIYRKLYNGEGRFPYCNPGNKVIFSKTICRVRTLSSLDIHHHHIQCGHTITSDGLVIPMAIHQNISETSLENSVLHLNHYAIQSYEFFMTIKVGRTDVHNENCNNVRNDDYFEHYDWNELLDTELKEKKNIFKK